MILHKRNNKNNTKYTRANHQLMLRIVTSYSVFLLIILFLVLFMLINSNNNTRYTYNINKQNALKSNAELFEKDLNIMEVYCRQLLQNNHFRSLLPLSQDHPNLVNLGVSVSNSLAVDVYPESLLPINEVFCYLKQSDSIISPSCFTSSSRYYHWLKHYNEANYVNWLEALTNPSNFYRFIPMDEFASKSENKYAMFCIDLNDLYYLNADAVVCFVLDQREINSLFDCLGNDYANALYICDSSNQLMLQSGTLVKESLITLETVQNLPYNAEGFSTFQAKQNHQKYNLTFGRYTSKKTGLTYYYSFPADENTPQAVSKLFIYITILSLVIFTGGCLIVLFSRQNIRPIIELGDKLQDAEVEKTQLQKEVDDKKPIIVRSYVRRLLLGMVTTEDEISYIKKYLKLDNSTDCFNGLYIVVYNNNEHAECTLSSDAIIDIILKAMKTFFGEEIYYFIPADRSLGILLYSKSDDKNNLIFKVNESIVQLHNYLLEKYDIWLFAGIGKNTDDFMNVWESYQQATEAASYISKNYFFFPYEFVKKDSKAFYYPPEISTKLIHFVTTGNKPQVLELFNLIHQENIVERSLPIPILKFLLSDIRNTLLKARFALPDTVSEDFCHNIDERFNEHMTFKLCEDIALSLCEQFNSPSEESTLIQAIEKYLSENYQDASLGLNKIAEEFQISETYLSHMFKEKTGVNFSTYLENLRMKEAAKLIKETDISLNEVFINVGYNNMNTFRRAFKKIYGVTPSSMRDKK